MSRYAPCTCLWRRRFGNAQTSTSVSDWLSFRKLLDIFLKKDVNFSIPLHTPALHLYEGLQSHFWQSHCKLHRGGVLKYLDKQNARCSLNGALAVEQSIESWNHFRDLLGRFRISRMASLDKRVARRPLAYHITLLTQFTLYFEVPALSLRLQWNGEANRSRFRPSPDACTGTPALTTDPCPASPPISLTIDPR